MTATWIRKESKSDKGSGGEMIKDNRSVLYLHYYYKIIMMEIAVEFVTSLPIPVLQDLLKKKQLSSKLN